MGFGRKVFGRKGVGGSEPGGHPPRELFSPRGTGGSTPFDHHCVRAEALANANYPASGCRPALDQLSADERGELLADLAGRPGLYDGYGKDKPRHELIAHYTLQAIWQTEIEVRPDHLPALLTLLVGNKSFREQHYLERAFDTLLRLIGSAIKQGAFLSSGDCEALAEMAKAIRSGHKSYRKSDSKKMIGRAERLEKLAGVEVSGTEFLMQRCEGAENPWAIASGERPNAHFWADLVAEVTIALEEIRADTKGNNKPAWMRDAAAFAAAWPSAGDIEPRFKAWEEDPKPLASLSQHNGKRTGFASPDAYRKLPATIELAQPHSRYSWKSDQIPGLDVLADLENPDWTALVEILITQRRTTKPTAAWQKEALALCRPLGLETVEARLHEWLALFHTPTLDKAVYTDVCNGERFAFAVDRLEEAHGDWPLRHGSDIVPLARALAMKLAGGDREDICPIFNTQLIRLDDHVYKNTRVTEGILGLPKPWYKHPDGRGTYETLCTWMRLSMENEEILRGVVWLVALMPDRNRAIQALERTAQTAATYMWTGEDGMRSKIVANAAIATLIAMGGNDIDTAVLRLSKSIENCTINPPLFKYLNRAA